MLVYFYILFNLIDKIERVQRYFTRRDLFQTKPPYMERFQILNLELLEARRIKSDLKLCIKIIYGLCDFDVEAFSSKLPLKPLQPEDTIKKTDRTNL